MDNVVRGEMTGATSALRMSRLSRLGRFSNFWTAGLLALALCVATAPAFAQSAGRVSGFVKDPSGAVVPGASVVLKDVASGTQLRTTSDASGFYSIDPVPPRTYDLIVSSKGFKTYTQSGISVAPASRMSVDVALQLGAEVQTVQVQGSALNLVPKSSGAEVPVIGSKEIENLGTEGRNTMELLTLLPGVVNTGFNPEFGSSTGQGINNFNVNGLRNDQNSIRLDNANMIDPGNAGGFIVEPNMDMVQEFSVKLSSFEADQGRGAMIVDAVTKSGGSKIHGEGYWYLRNAVFNANDWSNNHAGIKKPASKFNYPGFNIGGPVRFPGSDFNKNNDKMFFWVGMEWQKQLPDFGTQLAVAPSAAMRQGDFSQLLTDPACQGKSRCLNMPVHLLDPHSGGGWGNSPLPGNILPSSEMDPNSALLLNEYPYPNYYDPNGQFNFAGDPLLPLNRNEQDVRVDYNLTDNTRMYVRLARNHETNYAPWGLWSGINSGWTSNVPEPTPTVGDNLGESVSFNIVNVLNPTLTNEFQFNVQQLTLPNHYQDPAKMQKSTYGFQFSGMTFKNSQLPAFANGRQFGGDYMPQITDQWSFYNGGDPGTGRWGEGDVGHGIFADKTIFEFIDNVTKVHGTHTFKFGGNLDRTRNDQNGGPVNEGLLITAENWGGETTGNSFGDILANNFAAFEQGGPNNDGLWRFYNVEWYAQDSWKVTRRLTLNYGARFSWMQPWNEARGLATTFIPSAWSPSQSSSFLNGIVTPASGQVSHSIFPNPKPVFQPRLGLAWDMFGTGKTVFRAGFGTYVSRDQGNVSFYMANADPFSFTATRNAPGPFLTLQDIQATNPFSNVGNISVQAEDPHDPNQPQTYEWNVGFTQDIGFKTIVDAAYVGNVSRHLYRQVNINDIQPGGMWIPGTTDCCPNGDTNQADYRPYKPFGTIDLSTHSDTANYNSLQVTLRRNVSRGLTLLGSYTWSKTLGYTTSFQGVMDPFDSHRNYGILPWDHASIFNFSYIYQLPNVGAKYFAGSKIADGVLNGWQISGITHYTSGGPVGIGNATINCTMEAGATNNLCGGGAFDSGQGQFQAGSVSWYGTPDIVFRPVIQWKGGSFNHVGDHWFSPQSVSLPGIGQFGTFETPTFRGPWTSDWDMTLFKTFPLGEGRRLEFRFSGFNIFNHANLLPPNLSSAGSSFQTTPIFDWVLPSNATSYKDGHGVLANGDQLGVISDKYGHRELELALKLYF